MADQKITQLTEATSSAFTDIVPVVLDPSGSPVNRKMTIANMIRNSSGSVPTIYESAYASPPASPVNGDLWMITDGLLHARRTSGAWSYYWGTQKVTKPVLGDFGTWFNQGSATLDDYGQLVLYTPAAGTNLRGKVMSAPATPYNIDAIFIPGVENVPWMGAGLCWSDGTKYVSVLVGNINGGNANPGLDVYKWNTATSPLSGYTPDYAQTYTYPMRALPNVPIWVRLSDDGANRTVYISLDGGKHFQRYHQIGRTDHLTPTQIGICVYSDNANVDTVLTLLSWAQS